MAFFAKLFVRPFAKCLECIAAIDPNFTCANLFWRRIRDDDVINLANAFEGNKTAATHLYLAGNKITGVGASKLAKMLETNKTIEVLSLDHNNIADDGASKLAEMLKNNKTLRSLSLSSNKITDVGASKLAKTLRINEALEELVLNRNNITDVSTSKLAEMLQTNKTIQSLYLDNNIIADVGVSKLAETLQANKTIKVLSLAGNNITDVGASKLAEVLQWSNSTLIILRLQCNSGISADVMSKIERLVRINKESPSPDIALQRKADEFGPSPHPEPLPNLNPGPIPPMLSFVVFICGLIFLVLCFTNLEWSVFLTLYCIILVAGGMYYWRVLVDGQHNMQASKTFLNTSRYIAFDEPDNDALGPICGVFDDDTNPLVSINDAVASLPLKLSKLLWFANRFVKKAATKEKMKKYSGLTPCMAAAIYLYTAESPLYRQLNKLLREENRAELRGTPGNSFFPYIRLLLTAVQVMSSSQIKTINRGVKRNLVANHPNKYVRGESLMWWGFSSCTSNIEVLKNPQFLGTHGERTIFQLHTSKSVDVKDFSAIPSEAERLLPAGCTFRITGVFPASTDGLTIVTLEDDAEAPPLIE